MGAGGSVQQVDSKAIFQRLVQEIGALSPESFTPALVEELASLYKAKLLDLQQQQQQHQQQQKAKDTDATAETIVAANHDDDADPPDGDRRTAADAAIEAVPNVPWEEQAFAHLKAYYSKRLQAEAKKKADTALNSDGSLHQDVTIRGVPDAVDDAVYTRGAWPLFSDPTGLAAKYFKCVCLIR